MKYLTAIISIALTCALLLVELFTNNTHYIIEHAIQGCLISTLFLLFCNYGLEMINWIVLGAIPIFLFIGWIFTPQSNSPEGDDECDICQKPMNTCGCPCKKEPSECDRQKRGESMNSQIPIQRNECPANPMDLRTQCGITRFS
jgi:hypothetical protein